MNHLISQVSYPVFLYMTLLFFLIASAFSFLVGIGLALRSRRVMRLFDALNRWISVRQMIKPLTMPHDVEPTLMKQPVWLGGTITAGAAAALFLLQDVDLRPALLLFDGSLTPLEMGGIADNLKSFLLVGNAVCLLVGIAIVFFPRTLSVVERYTDHWYTVRRSTRPLDMMHMEVDSWVLKHPTSVGVTMSLLSVSLGVMMYSLLQSLPA
ncbi:MAG: hypothetical protein PHH36_00480 [Sideroxydans sp.]|nr:hypothetical protein [Sideroxydans sp.]